MENTDKHNMEIEKEAAAILEADKNGNHVSLQLVCKLCEDLNTVNGPFHLKKKLRLLRDKLAFSQKKDSNFIEKTPFVAQTATQLFGTIKIHKVILTQTAKS